MPYDHCAAPVDVQWRASVTVRSKAELLAIIDDRLSASLGFSVATLNLDHLVKLRDSIDFRRAYAEHSLVVADGHPVVWLSRLARRPVDLVPGCELVEPIAALAAKREAPIALLGTTEAVLERAAKRLEERAPTLEVAARIAPGAGFDPEGPEADACIAALAKSGARICFIALGAPKQERFAARAQRVLPQMGFVSIGAGLDFLAGSQIRAPWWLRRIAAEWLWRLALNPRRLTGRYLSCGLLLPRLAIDALADRREDGAPSLSSPL